MPAKVKFTKEAIIESAFTIANEQGLDKITIRSVAKLMGSSIAPIYVNFESVEALKKAVLDKAYMSYLAFVKNETHEDLFLRYAIASMKFSKRYPKMYDTFLLDEDNPSNSQRNFQHMLDTLKQVPVYNTLDDDLLTRFIITMQAMQVGLSLMARKSFYEPYLDEEAITTLLNDTGDTLMQNMMKTQEKKQ